MTSGAPRAVMLVGATASGKSHAAHELAFELGDVEIATIDSMTVYRGMDIGTAKASARERREVPYHLLDLVDPSDEFAVGEFQRVARGVADDVVARGRRILYVGGTGLYGRSVIDDFEIPPQFPEIRDELEKRSHQDLPGLVEELSRLDPVAADRMEPTNVRRVVRALEVTIGSGRPFSSFGPGVSEFPPSPIAQVGIRVDTGRLDVAIDRRFRRWMDEGLLEEVRRLAAHPAGLSRTARQAVGYRELLRHVEDGLDLDHAVTDAIAATRRLVRRQRSWFERDPRIEWFDTANAAANRIRALLDQSTPAVRD